MPTHKIANDFIRKYNKELAIKGYSRLSVKEKTALIEKRLKEVKSEMITDMKKEWSGITSKYSDKIKKNEAKRANKKKSETKKEKPEKKVKVKVKKEKAKTSLWTEYKDILDKNKSKLEKNKTPVKGKDVKNAYDYYNLLYSNRKKLKPDQYLKSLKDEVKLKGNDDASTKSSQIVPVKEKPKKEIKEKPKKEEKKEDERSKLIDEIIKNGDIEIEIDDMPSDGSPQMRSGFGENGIENVIKNWSSTIRMNKNTKQKIRNIIINEIKQKTSLGDSIIINFGYNDTQGITYGNELIIPMSKKELIFYLRRGKQILKEMLDLGEKTKDEVTEFTKLFNERIKELRSKK